MSISEEEINPHIQDDLSYQARPLEPKDRCYPVNFRFPEDALCTEFSFFEDGRQRTVNIGHIKTVINQRIVIIPVHFFAIGAVILHRDSRRELKLWRQPELRMGIIVERSLVPNQSLVEQFEQAGLEVIDTNTTGGDYSELRMRALRKAKDIRLESEMRLITQWRQSNEAANHFLIVDGTLMNFRNEDNVERCIGVSKSFGSRYFDSSDHNRILQMNEFERSWTFRFHDEDEDVRLGARERVSWYLRLRKRANADPEFGLIRVEISQRHMERASEYADRFSKSLLSERLPTAYPTPRWDKHLYPIQACEDYLSSILPSTSTIVATMKG
ncbi:hypothetical protein [Kallotenue papyrolyticum]|uniref:hypothetical protein n=1 Tax=Kallotenue papyrolyticum TaxID=1325125 RepID=UPI00126944C2|nr:hypothetical protein [Kallotenue papyrolyticum]